MKLAAGAADRWGIASRFLAAAVGGYAVVTLSHLASMAALPIAYNEALLFSSQAGYLTWTGVIVWCFAARTARRAWSGLALVAAPLALLAAWYLRSRGAS